MPPSSFDVNDVTCDGTPMTSSSNNNSSFSPSRHLLAAAPAPPAAAAANSSSNLGQDTQTAGAPSHYTDVVTTFDVPTPADKAARSVLIRTITNDSDKILTGGLNSFFGVPVKFKGAEQVTGSTGSTGTTPATSRSVPPSELPSGKAGAVPQQPRAAGEVPATVVPVPQGKVAPPPLPRPSPRATLPNFFPSKPMPAEPPPLVLPIPANAPTPAQTGKKETPALYTPAKPAKPLKPGTALPGKSPKPRSNNVLYEAVPTCSAPPTIGNSVEDTEGRLWGWESWQSCVFRDYVSVQPERVNSAWEAAPACTAKANSGNSVADSIGSLWGWENSKSCAFRAADYVPAAERPQPTWAAAHECLFAPSKVNSVADKTGQLWGWKDGHSCAFRGSYSKGTGGRQGGIIWSAAPVCRFAPTLSNSVPDLEGRLWGWQAGSSGSMESCVFRVSAVDVLAACW